MSPSALLSPTDDNYNNEGDGDNGDEIPDDEMLANKKTSFNGKLNKYFYHVTKADTAGTVSPAMRQTQTQTQTQKVQIKATAEPVDATGITTGRRVTRSQSSRLSTASASSSPSENTLLQSKRGSSSSSSSKKKRRLQTNEDPSFSPPSRLRDTIPPNLILLLVGVNPGLMTGATGYAYAHPSNLFWKLLHSSGITAVRHPPSDTYRLPELYSVGNTNIVERPTRDASMLSKAEMDAGVPVLEAKIAAQRPEAVGLVGKSIWEAVWRVKHGRPIRKSEFRYGWQDESENLGRTADWPGARVFVATTTSGLAATMSLAEKQAVWNELGRWVVQRREERKAAAAVVSRDSDASAVTTPAPVPVSVPTSASPYFADTNADSTES